MSESNRGKTEKYLTREMSFQPSAMYNDDEENFEKMIFSTFDLVGCG